MVPFQCRHHNLNHAAHLGQPGCCDVILLEEIDFHPGIVSRNSEDLFRITGSSKPGLGRFIATWQLQSFPDDHREVGLEVAFFRSNCDFSF